MTLTVCIGSSGSGKTTFLNDVHESHKCTYIRQYHNMRPYIVVTKIPNFDPTALPYWDIYENEGKAESIKVGGTMAGEFTAGLSGGQRKLLLFELIYQRTKDQSELLIVLDEPFAGVTDDFVPFITKRLELMREKHNILLVTNDHVQTLTDMANNTITVSAIDRTHVKINSREAVDREKAIFALSVGDEYAYKASKDDLKFFYDVEIASNKALFAIAAFTAFCFGLFLATFWGSDEDSQALVLVAGGIIAYFCVNPYLLALVEWRNAMLEEAEALVHSSKGYNKALKSLLTTLLVVVISLIEYGVVNATVDGLGAFKFWIAMLLDSASLTFPLIALGIYTKMPFQAVEIFGSLPFLLMIFFSTTFSPGSGLAGLKELRYIWSRFYFWCMVPSVQDDMEGCPAENNMLYLVLSSFVGLFVFLFVKLCLSFRHQKQSKKTAQKRADMMDDEFVVLQVEMYGTKVLKRLQHLATSSTHGSVASVSSYGDVEDAAVAV